MYRTAMQRVFPFVMAALAVVLFTNENLVAQEVHEGVVVAAGNGGLTMTDIYGENMRSYMVAPNARIILDGVPARLEELKMSDHVVVGTKRQDRHTTVAIRIDGHSVR